MLWRRPKEVVSDSLTSRRREPDGGTMVVPTMALVQQLLDEFGLRHSIDDDGDLVVRWEKCSVFFFFYGEKREILQARLYLNRRFDVDSRGALALLLDEWNRVKLFPKAYTVLPDDGRVGICAEQCFDFEAGATRGQVKYAVGLWVDTLLRFTDWVDEQV
ncbi:YbjN domain-containing protein [Jatrophihabitans sp.]|uniref:YbjN domain-containing protein n=1 Tax=Jatrophihabitans sp. TaxID=1932789 RepID=UPI0030C6CB3C